jgi:hypothetical protein
MDVIRSPEFLKFLNHLKVFMDEFNARPGYDDFVQILIDFLHKTITCDVSIAENDDRHFLIGTIANHAIKMASDRCPSFDKHLKEFIAEYYKLVDELHNVIKSKFA